MREASRAERTLRDAEWRPDRASAEAARGCIRFRQEPDTRTGVSSLDTPAMDESYSIRGDLTTPQSILPRGIFAAPAIGLDEAQRLDRITECRRLDRARWSTHGSLATSRADVRTATLGLLATLGPFGHALGACYRSLITDVVMLPCGRPLLELTVRLQ